ncbi:hypothetical protein E4T56_gene11422 [Termitomyces sp. T112]|nr:hypothetical protein E4T56_gene11422 [Termitomyces sp. T112]
MPTHPVPALALAAPLLVPYPQGLPWMHFAWHCLLGLEVHYLSALEQEELFLQLLATKDAAGALLLDEPSSELTLEEVNVSASPLELESDF